MSAASAKPLVKPGSSSISTSTGSMTSHQPPGGESFASSGAGSRSAVSSHVLPHPTTSRTNAGILSPVWLSTSSRPIGSGSNLMSPGLMRMASPPQPPPLPPPPPSPQLVPLKARLARSNSVATPSVGSPFIPAHHRRRRWDTSSVTSRYKASSHISPRPLREPQARFERKEQITIPKDGTDIESRVVSLPFFSPITFFPIKHPRERSAVSVCFASLVFLSISVIVTTIFSAAVLPFCLLACLIRRTGVWMANFSQRVLCCRCNRPQLRADSHNPVFVLFSRLLMDNNDSTWCNCVTRVDGSHPSDHPLRALSPAELRWLPALEHVDDPDVPQLIYSPISAPLITICLRFGAPGVKLPRLREVIASRLLNRHPTPSSSLTSSPRSSNVSNKWNAEQRQRTSSLVPPADTISRLTQCLTCLSTGYAWRECLAFRLEDHVMTVPQKCLPNVENKGPDKLSRSASSSNSFDVLQQSAPISAVHVESIVQSLNKLPLPLNRPLWQAYLLEQYQEVDSPEPSDIESAAESDDLNAHEDKYYSVRSGVSSPGKRSHFGARVNGECKATPSSSSLICRRTGATGVGSLLVFRLHAALSDDGRALVHLLTNCLADSPTRSHTPTSAPCGQGDKGSEGNKPRWRGRSTKSIKEKEQKIESVDETRATGWEHSKDPSSSSSKSPETSKSSCSTSQTTVVTANPSVHTAIMSVTNAKPPEASNFPVGDETRLLQVMEDEDSEESESAQWWYTFWSSSLATIATCCDLIRALLTGPAIILHKYFFTQADMGLLAKIPKPTIDPSSSSVPSNSSNNNPHRLIYRCALLSLVKLSRVRQVTKASYSEIILSLLAGALRAYHQALGLKNPPDLLAFLSTEVPVLPGCTLSGTERGSSYRLNAQRCDGSPCPGMFQLLATAERPASLNSVRYRQTESLVETGLMNNDHRMVAMGSPSANIDKLCPGRHVLAEICLPINTEGMLPRLWETRQRLIELNNSVDPLCLAWARSVVYTLMPHSLACWLEQNFGGSSKASVSVTGVEVVSPFSGRCQSKEHVSTSTYQMPPTRRLAYMSLLASKSAEARGLRRRLRKRLPRGALVYPPRLGTSFRALARHLTNANAGLVYIAGSPVIRIDTWMPSPRLAGGLYPTPVTTTVIDSDDRAAVKTEQWMIFRDLSVAFTTYAGQLSITFSASSALDDYTNLGLILEAMRIQLRKMCRLLAGRHVPTPTDRWLTRSSSYEPPSSAPAVNLSPSLNPSLVLRPDSTINGSHAEASSSTNSNISTSADNQSTKRAANSSSQAHSSPSHSAMSQSNQNLNNSSQPIRPEPHDSVVLKQQDQVPPTSAILAVSDNPLVAYSNLSYSCQSDQPIEQDPDFYINGWEDDDDYEDEELDASGAVVTSYTTAATTQNFVLTTPAPTGCRQSQKHVTQTGMLSRSLLPYRIKRLRKNELIRVKNHTLKSKSRQIIENQGYHQQRRSLLTGADVTTLDITPIRRGSLGSGSGLTGTEGFLARLLRPKLSNSVFTKPDMRRGTRTTRK
ncbi:unnamed protein product [Calicophoron daubneyi]|uniref:Uncharacterized protein n=1 Tax=Calicophoron daubneyi TaxID=300641 RepID=A0AAV2THY1_CALDB